MPVFRAVSNENTEIHDGSELHGTLVEVVQAQLGISKQP
jgi:hypothetical protein